MYEHEMTYELEYSYVYLQCYVCDSAMLLLHRRRRNGERERERKKEGMNGEKMFRQQQKRMRSV